MPEVVYDHSQIDFSKPGKHHYQVAFHEDSRWGYSLVPLTVINGLRRSVPQARTKGVMVSGGTHGNEYEGQVAVKRLCQDLDPAEISGCAILIPQLSQSACVANTRSSPLDGVNMNRAFPGNPHGTITYRIANFEGELVGRLHDFWDHTQPALEMRAQRSGVLIMMHFPAVASKGTTLYVVSEEVQI